MPIDRCYCREIPFTELLDLARRNGLDVEALGDLTGAGTGCGLCRTYLRVVLATGRTSLPVLSDDEVERMCREGADAGTGVPRSPGA